MSTIKFMTAALLLLDLSPFVIAQTSNGNCNSGGCWYEVNCSFAGEKMCTGWTNLRGSDSLDWLTNDTCPTNGDNGCLTVDFTDAPANSNATLESPCMCATGLNASILSFVYAIPGGKMRKNCPLSVYLTTDTNRSLLWNSTQGTLNKYTQAQIEISSSNYPFKILIEGKTTDNEPCASGGNKTRIDNIIYEGVAPSTLSPPESTATSKSLSTTETSPIPSAVSLTTSSGQGSLSETKAEETLDVGVAAGIGVGAVALIALIVALLLYLWKRRTRKDETNSQLASEETANTDTLETVVDPSYQADNDHTAGSLPGAVTAETYERLAARPDSKFYTTLANQKAPTPENYEMLTARPGSHCYTDLTTAGNQQPVSTPENYELLTVTPEASHYTTLSKSGHMKHSC